MSNVLERLGDFDKEDFKNCHDNDSLVKKIKDFRSITAEIENWQATGDAVFLACLPVITLHLESAYNKTLSSAKQLNSDNEVIGKEQHLKAEGKHITSLLNEISKKLDAIMNSIGTSSEADDTDGCYIATATIGDENHLDLILLREFRDKYMKNTIVGRLLISTYYSTSPYLAKVIEEREFYRALSSFLFVKPLVMVVRVILGK